MENFLIENLDNFGIRRIFFKGKIEIAIFAFPSPRYITSSALASKRNDSVSIERLTVAKTKSFICKLKLIISGKFRKKVIIKINY